MKALGLTTVARRCALALLAFATLTGTSHAQLAAVGRTTAVATFVVRGTDAAHDPRTNTYLMIGAQGPVLGVCVSPEGQPLGAPFNIKPIPSGTFGAFPRASYSPDLNGGAGGFLVVWTEEVPGVTVQLHARTVSCAGPIGGDQIISTPTTSWIDIGVAAVAYSTTSRQFLVAWKTMPGQGALLMTRLVDLSGAAVGNAVQISPGFGRDPGVAWNPNTNEFGVSFSGEAGNSVYSAFVKVPAANPAAFSRTTFNVLPMPMATTITDLAFDTATNHYLMSWFELSSGAYAKVAEFDANGTLLSQNIASTRMGSYDALSLAFNPISHTSLLVGVDRATDGVLAAELNASGIRITPTEPLISTSAPPARYPRVATNTTTATWNANWSIGFQAIASQIVSTGGAAGGPTTPPPPPAPVTGPKLALDSPRANSALRTDGFTIGGWAADTGAPDGTGVNAVHVWAFPVGGGAGTFVGAAQYGISRPDVGAALGSARFNNSGFSLTGALGAGTYDLQVFARSTVTGTFNNAQVVRITVQPPVSAPRMAVDFPTTATTLSMNITVEGWAIDLGGSRGPGVDAVHVWAYPIAGGGPIFVGATAPAANRPDVARAFGSTRFMTSGFTVQGTLPRGEYNLVVFARSTLTRTFNNVSVIRIRVV